MGDPCRCSGFESHTTYHHVLVLVFLPVMKVVTSKKQMICLWFFFRFSILYIRLKSRSCITWTQTPNLLGKLRHQDGPLEICINLIYNYIQLLFAHIKWVDNSEFFFCRLHATLRGLFQEGEFQFLAISDIWGAWEGAQIDMVSFGPPYLSGGFLWSAYLKYRQKLVTLF